MGTLFTVLGLYTGAVVTLGLVALLRGPYQACWHEWEGFSLEPWQERGFALFVMDLSPGARGLFWMRNACNDRCKKCGKEQYEVGQGYVPPWYFEDDYQRKHPKTIAKGIRSAPFPLGIAS